MKGMLGSLSGEEGDVMPLIMRALRCLRRSRVFSACCVIALMAGVEATVALGASNAFAGVILSGCLLTLLGFCYLNLLLQRSQSLKPKVLNVADLLERDVVPLETIEADAVLNGQVVLVTGAAGSIGSELCRQLLNYEPARVIALDNNETGLFDLVESLRSYRRAECLSPYIADITDVRGMARFFAEARPQVVFHAAAYKHVPLLEQHPEQAIRTNALATYHLCLLAREYESDRFVFVSTDKAAEPTSVLGASKCIGEMVVQSLAQSAHCTTRFCAVRFGNVIGSRGSVVPVFAQQIRRGGPVTITDPDATRYFMTIPEACGLVIHTAAIAEPGGLYLLDMGSPIRIVDLALKMIRAYGLRPGRDISVVYTGLRPGERLHETLVAANEELNATTHNKIFRVAAADKVLPLPAIHGWCHVLEEHLHHKSSDQLRTSLFEFVREKDLLVVSGGHSQVSSMREMQEGMLHDV